MGRVDSSGKHEGWVAQVFEDGQVGAWENADGVGLSGDWVTVRPFSAVVAWRVMCQCGWTGGTFLLSDERDEDIDREYAAPTEAREDELLGPWLAHIATDETLWLIEQLAEKLEQAESEIRREVTLARGGGASWSQIGDALGVSRQAAQQRFGS